MSALVLFLLAPIIILIAFFAWPRKRRKPLQGGISEIIGPEE